jgi:uncharacterized protein YdbL (DUF1318 family)
VSQIGCTFKFDVTSQKTALENQAVGKYEELEDDLVLVSSVRGVSENAGKLDPVTLAKQNKKFNLDDLEELKTAQILGEANDGRLVLLPAGTVKDLKANPDQMALAKILVGEEAVDRATIWKDIIANNKNLTAADEPAVRKTFAKQTREETKDGQWFQDPSGQWMKKQAE